MRARRHRVLYHSGHCPVQFFLSICGSETSAPTLCQYQNPWICKPLTYLMAKHGSMCLEPQGLLEYISSVLPGQHRQTLSQRKNGKKHRMAYNAHALCTLEILTWFLTMTSQCTCHVNSYFVWLIGFSLVLRQCLTM